MDCPPLSCLSDLPVCLPFPFSLAPSVRRGRQVDAGKRQVQAVRAEAEEQQALLARRLLGMESRVSREGLTRAPADALKAQLALQAQLEVGGSGFPVCVCGG